MAKTKINKVQDFPALPDREFNVSDEPFIPVETIDENFREVSLENTLLNSQNYLRLASETPPLNAALLRPMLGIVHWEIYHYAADGQKEDAQTARQLLERWEEIWQEGYLPQEPIKAYFREHYDDFWLFDPKKPFMQANIAEKGTEYPAAKLIQDCLQSSNKTRLFNQRAGDLKNTVSYPEAARYLLGTIAYDDTSAKSSVRGLESPGAGWLGRLGQIYAVGKNLFQTLMLNCVLIKENGTLWPDDQFSWDADPKRWTERHHVVSPDDFGSYMTWRSRLIKLHRSPQGNGTVDGFNLLGGEFFDKENNLEPFTIWAAKKGKKDEPASFTPRRHSDSRQLWRDFQILMKDSDKDVREPGIISWLKRLERDDLLPYDYPIRIEAPYVTYGDKDFFVTNLSSQNFSVYPGMFSEEGEDIRELVEKEITAVEDTAISVGRFFQNISLARGGSQDSADHQFQIGKADFYQRIDEPFRDWLISIRPQDFEDPSAVSRKEHEWHETVVRIVWDLCKEKLSTALSGFHDLSALLGRNKGDQGEKISAIDAERWLKGYVKKLYPDVFNNTQGQNTATKGETN